MPTDFAASSTHPTQMTSEEKMDSEERRRLVWLKCADQHETMAVNCERAGLLGIAQANRDLAQQCRERSAARLTPPQEDKSDD